MLLKWFLFEDFARYKVDTWCDTVITAVSDTTVTLKSPEGEKIIEDVDSIVFAIGGKPNKALALELADTGVAVTTIGDAKGPRDGVNAFYEGYMAAYDL